MKAYLRAFWVWSFVICVSVSVPCYNLQTCYQCGVACQHNETLGISQAECISYIDQTSIHVAEYHPSETKCVLGSCTGITYNPPINILGYTANLDVRSFRYSCVPDCPVFELEEAWQIITDSPTDSQAPVSRSDCISMCFDTVYCYMWDYYNSVCQMYQDCGPTASCSTSFSLSYRTYTRTCLSSCGELASPVNGYVTYTDTVTNSIASFGCDVGFDEVTGSSTRTCLSNGTWSSPQPSCEAESSSTTALSSSTATTSTSPETTSQPFTSSSSVTTTTTSPTSASSQTFTVPSSTTPGPVKRLFIMPCFCYENKTFIGKTEEEIITLLIRETKINTKNTTLAKSRLISEGVFTASSNAIGFAGLGLILLVFGSFIVCDVLMALYKLKEMLC